MDSASVVDVDVLAKIKEQVRFTNLGRHNLRQIYNVCPWPDGREIPKEFADRPLGDVYLAQYTGTSLFDEMDLLKTKNCFMEILPKSDKEYYTITSYRGKALGFKGPFEPSD